MKTLALVVLALGPAPLAGAATLTTIGAAAAVHGKVNATAPGAAVGRVLNSGKPLFLNDHVTSDAQGKLQVLLLDETVFTLGPNADMVLDQFVYDPNTSAGKVEARVTKGAFRFVTGKVARAHPEDMTVKMKIGTIGIRGTVVVGDNLPDGSIAINAGAGPSNNADERPSAISVSNEGKTVNVTQTGEGARAVPGGGVQGPFDFTKELDRISAVLQIAPTGKQGSGGSVEDASKTSGQNTAAGKLLAIAADAQKEDSREADQVQSQTAQQGLIEGVSRWGDLSQLQGTASYQSPTINVACSGTGCGVNTTAVFDTIVNFDTHQISSGFVQVSGTGFGSASANFNSGFGTSGPATITLANGVNSNNPDFNGSKVSFINQGGVAAAEMQMNLNYNNTTSNVHMTNTTLTAPKR